MLLWPFVDWWQFDEVAKRDQRILGSAARIREAFEFDTALVTASSFLKTPTFS